MKKRNIFWGIFFIAAAVFLIASKMGYFAEVNVASFILGVLIAVWFIKSLLKLEYTGIFFSAAFLCIVFAKPLGITDLTPWPVLGAALLGSIGCSFLFPKRNKLNRHHMDRDASVEYDNEQKVYCHCKFGAVIKYINSEDFREANMDCSFGGLKVYLDGAHILEDHAEIHVDMSFGGLELYVPREWEVINEINAVFGGVEEKNRMISPTGPTLYLSGNLKFAGVTIIYV